MEESELLQAIYGDMVKAEALLHHAYGLMEQREKDYEILACQRNGARAGWSRFLAQMHGYSEHYGLLYLQSLDEVRDGA